VTNEFHPEVGTDDDRRVEELYKALWQALENAERSGLSLKYAVGELAIILTRIARFSIGVGWEQSLAELISEKVACEAHEEHLELVSAFNLWRLIDYRRPE
jgi:hypothetical protein